MIDLYWKVEGRRAILSVNIEVKHRFTPLFFIKGPARMFFLPKPTFVYLFIRGASL